MVRRRPNFGKTAVVDPLLHHWPAEQNPSFWPTLFYRLWQECVRKSISRLLILLGLEADPAERHPQAFLHVR